MEDVLQKRPTTPTLKRHAISYMSTHTKSFTYTRSVLVTLDKQARDEIRRLGGNAKLEGILDYLKVPD
jgi:geranylgeranyl diphosphate synthase type 3